MNFEQWTAHVDAELQRVMGLDIGQFPDQDYRALYDQGMDPKAAATKAIDEECQKLWE